MKLIGLSLSLCVQDIIEGKVAVQDVAFIEARTRIANSRDMFEVIESYQKSYWYKDPERGADVALFLFDDGRIVQPRLESEPHDMGRYAIPINSESVTYHGRALGGHWASYSKKGGN